MNEPWPNLENEDTAMTYRTIFNAPRAPRRSGVSPRCAANHESGIPGGKAERRNARFALLAGLLALAATGCDNRAAEVAETIRPVRVFRVGDQAGDYRESFAGEVKARYETKLSFRVPGKIVSRQVEVGDGVRKGELLAQLDETDYQLAAKGLTSQLAAARAERDFAQDDLVRYRELLEQNFISQAEHDRRETVYKTARDRVEALQAQLDQANNQLAYTRLYADRDGVVTALDAETGQVVSTGQTVVTVAQLDEKEVAISIPEHRIGEVRGALDVAVTLWADDERPLKGRVREIAPSADPLSRTYRVKVTLLEGEEVARLGMTATVHLPERADDRLAVPLSAVFQTQNDPSQPRVWLVDEHTHAVKSVPIQTGEPVAGQRIAAAGLAPGQLVVSAGVNRLVEGQAVRILSEDADPSTAGNGTDRLAGAPGMPIGDR